MSPKTLNPKIDVLLQTCDQAYIKEAWHGANLRGSIRGLSLKELLWRPNPKRHNIWEIVLHCAYWKYAVWRRITDGMRGAFPRGPSDWPKLPDRPDVKKWKEDLALLEEWHRKLRGEIMNFPPSKLDDKPKSSRVSFIRTFYGISSHDLYHAGQIQLLKRLQRG
ncbi:MAG: DinB family protein [Candidatus Zixiibacteriota bacterium]|nr:MAG: DinB family protein [candidate division Zixibacteria bacterium]